MAIVRPSSDIVTGGWSSTGSTLYETIDETTASDADYISSSTSGQIARIALGSTTDPGVDTGHVLRYRADHDTSDGLGVNVKVVETGSFPFIVPSRKVWTRQPHVPVEVDWSNPLTKGLRSVWRSDGLGYYKDLAGINHGVPSATLDINAINSMVGRKFAGSQYINCGNDASVHPTDFTMVSLFYPTNVTSNYECLSTHYSGSGYALEIGSGVIKALIGATGSWKSSQSSISANAVHVAIGLNSATNKTIQLVLDGVASSLTDYSASSYTSSSQALWIGGAAAYGNYFNGTIFLTALFNRCLSVNEAIILSKNPWQIFKPRTQTTYVDPGYKLIATRTPTLTTSPADYTIDLSEAEAATITDYSALAIEVEST